LTGKNTMLERLYRQLRLIRRTEEVTAEIYPTDKIKSPVHLAIGQEHVSVAVCDHLTNRDWVGGSYRSHAMFLAKGGNLKAMMAEMFGKAAGCCGGKGGSMHLVDPEAGVMGSSAVVGTQIPMATGYALAQQMDGTGASTVVFFGDGATEEGCFYESLNFAALKKLPILYVCENNGYAIHEPIWKRRAKHDLCDIADSLGVPGVRIDSGELLDIHKAASTQIAAIRAGQGPQFLECRVYRWKQHVGPGEDFNHGYRSPDEAAAWFAADQVTRLGAMLDASMRARIDADIEAIIADAVRFAEETTVPDARELYSHVFV
jgi:TPP-dependent pyruvate/acetoin dehydrogenase alpha subunit